MRLGSLLILLVIVAPAFADLQTDELDLATTPGAAADGTVTISRDASDNMVFRDGQLPGTTASLSDLAGGGVSDHGNLSGLADDDHNSGANAYYTAGRLNTKFGNSVSTSTNGATWVAGIAIPTDPAGLATLGGHLTTDTIHWYRPSRVVTVAKTDSLKKGEYSTIQAAVNSITDSGPTKRYAVLIYPGIYSEQVTLSSDYISLIGVDRNACAISWTGNVTLTISATNPGSIEHLTIDRSDSQGQAGCVDGSSVAVFRNVKFTTDYGIGYQRTAAGSVSFYGCAWVDDDTGGYQSTSIDHGGNVNVYYYLSDCYFDFDDTLSDPVVMTNSGGAGATAYIFNCRLDPTVEHGAGEGCFKLTASAHVYLYHFTVGPEATIIHSSSTGGTIHHAFVQTADWGSPTSGLTTTPIALSGAQFTSNVDINAADLEMSGILTIDRNRNGYFNNINATTGTFTYISVQDLYANSLTTSETIVATDTLQARVIIATETLKVAPLGANVWRTDSVGDTRTSGTLDFLGSYTTNEKILNFQNAASIYGDAYILYIDGFNYIAGNNLIRLAYATFDNYVKAGYFAPIGVGAPTLILRQTNDAYPVVFENQSQERFTTGTVDGDWETSGGITADSIHVSSGTIGNTVSDIVKLLGIQFTSPTLNYFLKYDGSDFSWAAGTGASPGGASGDVQYNDGGGGFAGETAFDYDAAKDELTVVNVNATSGSFSAKAVLGDAVTDFVSFLGIQLTSPTTRQILWFDGSDYATTSGAGLGLGGSGTPGGSNTQVQYNNGGSFGGDSGLTYTSATQRLDVGGALYVDGLTTFTDSLHAHGTWDANHPVIDLTSATVAATGFLLKMSSLVYIKRYDIGCRILYAYDEVHTNDWKSYNAGVDLGIILNAGKSLVIKDSTENMVAAIGDDGDVAFKDMTTSNVIVSDTLDAEIGIVSSGTITSTATIGNAVSDVVKLLGIQLTSPTLNYFLKYDGTDFSWASGTGASPGGASGDVQYNNGGGGFAGEAAFNYDATDNELTVTNVNATSGSFSSKVTLGDGISDTVIFAGYDFGTSPVTNYIPKFTGSAITWQADTGGSGSPGGSGGDVQYNNGAGGFAGEAAFDYNATTNELSVDQIDVTTITITNASGTTYPLTLPQRVKIYDVTLTTSGSFDCQNISANYEDLELRLDAKATTTADDVEFYVYFNNSQTNYTEAIHWFGIQHDTGSVTYTPIAGYVVGRSGTARQRSSYRYWVQDYRSTTYDKILRGHGNRYYPANDHGGCDACMVWSPPSPAAINRVTVSCPGYNDAFAAGSRLRIYCVRD